MPQKTNHDWVQLFNNWLQEEVSPLANKLDRHPEVLKTVIKSMGDCQASHGHPSLLALKVPTELGGGGLAELEYRRWQIMMARTSGALTFLQTQHQSAAKMLASSSNKFLQQQFLPSVATGNNLIGVGFSHLRRRGVPIMKAEETADGYLLSGEVPWITGYNFFDYFICGATLADGKELYGILPFRNQSRESDGTIIFSQPMELIAMAATNTVSAKLDCFFLSRDRLVNIKPAGSIHHSSRRNILNHGFFALGCAYAGLDILWTLREKKQLNFLQESWQSLHQEVQECEAKAIASISDNNIAYQQKLELRAVAINLAQRCSMAAVIAASGAANYLNSSAGRVYREALLFSVSGQTTEVMEASLKKLLTTISSSVI